MAGYELKMKHLRQASTEIDRYYQLTPLSELYPDAFDLLEALVVSVQ